MSKVVCQDFNQFKNYRWVRPPIITCIGRMIQVYGLIKTKHRVETIHVLFYGYEPISYLNSKVIHWSFDCSKCFTYENGKSVEYKGDFLALT
jgi:hypothetical protein